MSLSQSAEIILKECMDVKKGEKVLIITDKNKSEIGKILLKKAKDITDAMLIEIPVAKFNGQEPPSDVADWMKSHDVIIMATTKSLSHTKARKEASNLGARIASMPGITEKMMERALDIDYKKMSEKIEKINRFIKGQKRFRITTDRGTDLLLEMHENYKFVDKGIYHKKNSWGNLPAGEAGGAPLEDTANGIVVVDGSFAGVGKLEEPIKLIIEKGMVVKIQGGKEAKQLRVLLESFKDKRVYNIAELGIGTNPKAKISGNVLEDEKVLGTAHIAVGNNLSYGGKVDAPCHLDGVFFNPTIFVDKKKIIEKGKILL